MTGGEKNFADEAKGGRPLEVDADGRMDDRLAKVGRERLDEEPVPAASFDAGVGPLAAIGRQRKEERPIGRNDRIPSNGQICTFGRRRSRNGSRGYRCAATGEHREHESDPSFCPFHVAPPTRDPGRGQPSSRGARGQLDGIEAFRHLTAFGTSSAPSPASRTDAFDFPVLPPTWSEPDPTRAEPVTGRRCRAALACLPGIGASFRRWWGVFRRRGRSI